MAKELISVNKDYCHAGLVKDYGGHLVKKSHLKLIDMS